MLRLTAQSLLAHARTLRVARTGSPRSPDAHLLASARADAAVVAALVTRAALCLDCIARGSKLTRAQVIDAFGRITSTMKAEERHARCGRCERETAVHRLA
jgi:hypothetical protein